MYRWSVDGTGGAECSGQRHGGEEKSLPGHKSGTHGAQTRQNDWRESGRQGEDGEDIPSGVGARLPGRLLRARGGHGGR